METDLLKAELVSKPGGGRHWDFTADQAERARLLKALHTKGATLSQLARANLAFDGAQAFVVFHATSCAPAVTPPRPSPRW